MNSKSVCRFPMQEQKCHCHNGKFTCKNTIEIATDAENRDEKKNCKNTNYISGKVLEKNERSFFQGRLKCFQVSFPDREKDLKMKGYAEKRRLLRFEKGNVQATDRKRKKQKQRKCQAAHRKKLYNGSCLIFAPAYRRPAVLLRRAEA